MAATYPTTAKTFATREAGTKIKSEYLNDVQVEVTAIAAQLIAGGVHIATATPTANAVPKANGAGRLALGWMPVQYGTVNVPVLAGGRLSNNGLITFSPAFTTLIGVFLTIEDTSVFAVGEMPIQVLPNSATVSGFYPQIVSFANVAADRTAVVQWIAVGY